MRHRAARLTIRIDDAFDGFRDRYQRAVPEFQADRLDALIDEGAYWQRVLDATAEDAPHDFILHWSRDFTSLMGLAGDRNRCVAYLVGNHTIAQRMYRYNPAVTLYAPLRTALVEDADNATWFTFEQSSSQFGSFNTPHDQPSGCTPSARRCAPRARRRRRSRRRVRVALASQTTATSHPWAIHCEKPCKPKGHPP